MSQEWLPVDTDKPLNLVIHLSKSTVRIRVNNPRRKLPSNTGETAASNLLTCPGSAMIQPAMVRRGQIHNICPAHLRHRLFVSDLLVVGRKTDGLERGAKACRLDQNLLSFNDFLKRPKPPSAIKGRRIILPKIVPSRGEAGIFPAPPRPQRSAKVVINSTPGHDLGSTRVQGRKVTFRPSIAARGRAAGLLARSGWARWSCRRSGWAFRPAAGRSCGTPGS